MHKISAQQEVKVQQALALQKEGKLDAAQVICEEILREQSNHAGALHLLGIIKYQIGEVEGALDFLREAVMLEPNNAVFHYHHGLAFHKLQKFDAAIASYDRAIEADPDAADAHMNRGNACAALKQYEAAIISYDKAAALRPQASHIYFNLGQVLLELKEYKAAAGSFSKALELKPEYAEAHNYLGVALQKVRLFRDAEDSFLHAIEIKPDYAEAYCNLGNALEAQSYMAEAAESYRQAIVLKPEFADAQNNLGTAFLGLGRAIEASASFRRALAVQPNHELAYSNLIFTLDLLTSSDTALLQAERKRWCALFAPETSNPPPFLNAPNPARRLRIGYVSADFRRHSAPFAFGAMLHDFDPVEFEVFAYSNSSEVDEFTHLFRRSATHWRDIVDMPDEAVAAMIRNDGIDILVDLSGHSRGNRLRVFAKKPAPIQITAWGFNTGTGLKAIDVIFGDEIGIPEDEKRFYAEKVRNLPSTISAFYPTPFPEVNELPALSGGRLVFGSFNRLCKVSDEALKLWARILLAVPESVLLFKANEINDAKQKEGVLEQFSAAGIDRERVILASKTSWDHHVAAYNQVDICLDTFPHNGGVTTLEALMMGVPVVTLKWPTLVGRLSASFLTTLGLTDWIAETPDEYVDIAVRKARALPALNELRQSLRKKMRNSIIGDTKAYAAVVEKEYRSLWQEWCARQKSGSWFRKLRLW